MADSNQSAGQTKTPDRRTFLKVGAGVVAGAAVVGVASVAYYNNVLGDNSSSSSSAVGSLQNALSSTQEQLSSTQNQLNSTASQLTAAQGQVSSLNNQLTSTQAQLSSASSQLSGVNTQLSATQQALTSANGQITSLNGQVTSLNSAVSAANSKVTTLQGQVGNLSEVADAFSTLSLDEANVLEAAIETLIPTDSNGPGGKEAGVIYFIDKQLGSDYGKNGNMYNLAPFVMGGLKGPITVEGITYTSGTPATTLFYGHGYNYAFNFRSFWRDGLAALETYATSAYGGKFETLSATVKAQVLTDLTTNKPTKFNNIVPNDFFSELFFMSWSGYLMDPMYGGNRGMVGWNLTGFNGLNQGNFYGEGLTKKQLMVASTPTKLRPASLADFQQGMNIAGSQ